MSPWRGNSGEADQSRPLHKRPRSRIRWALAVKIRSGALIDSPVATVFEHCLEAESYPSFMPEVVAVQPSDGHSNWTTRINGRRSEWTATSSVSEEHWTIEWRSAEAPWSRLRITLASLGVASTWVACSLEADEPL